MQAELYANRDRQKQYLELHEANEKLKQTNAELKEELQTQGEYLAEVELKNYEANVNALDLLKQVKQAESENESLKAYILDLKQKVAIYVPVKNDPIDEHLAHYINNFPERHKLKIMFLRESEGVYTFGSKKILI